MKRLEEHSKAELLELTPEQINTLIDLECAHAGIRLLPELPEKPDLEPPEPDVVIFNVEGATFVNLEDAQKVADLMSSLPRCRYYTWDNEGVKDENNPIVVQREKAFSPGHASRTANQKEEIKRRQKIYDDAKREFDKINNERKDIRESVHEALNVAQSERDRIDAYKREYDKYLGLANGDSEIAMNFLLKARNEETEFIEQLKTEISIDRMVNSAKVEDIVFD